MGSKTKVLFICRHNSGRSQIAEAYLRRYFADDFEIESAGLAPAESVNPLVVKVMKEEGIDLSDKKPQSVFELFKQGRLYSHVITVCHDSEHQCPVFPGITQRWFWPFPDPAAATGTPDEKLAKVREIRDMIKRWILDPGEGTFSFKTLMRE
ncbi:MAG TPA: arsenate reductase ArsC [Desulfobacterales bacterium]